MSSSCGDDSDAAALDRILNRVVMATDSELGGILVKLLPGLLKKLDGTSEVVRTKSLEICSHLSRRLRGNQSLPIPVVQLAEDACQKDSLFKANFALAFLELGMSSMNPESKGCMAQTLMSLLGNSPLKSRSKILKLILLSHDGLASLDTVKVVSEPKAAILVSVWFRDVLATNVGIHSPVVYMAEESLEALSVFDRSMMIAMKRSILHILQLGIVSPSLRIPALLAGACDGYHEVSERSESQLKALSLSGVTGVSSTGLLLNDDDDDANLATRVLLEVEFGILNGGSNAALGNRALMWALSECNEEGLLLWQTNTAVRIAVRGVTAKELYEGIDEFEAEDLLKRLKLRATCAHLLGFLSDKCKDVCVCEELGSTVLDVLQDSRDMEMCSGNGVTQSLRSRNQTMEDLCLSTRRKMYESIASLAYRFPQHFTQSVTLLGILLTDLKDGNQSLRVYVTSALGSLRLAYQKILSANVNSSSQMVEMRVLLQMAANSQEPRLRAISAEWASSRIFPFDDAEMLLLCVLLSADDNERVRVSATRGLKPISGNDEHYPSFDRFISELTRYCGNEKQQQLETTLSVSQLAAVIETSLLCSGPYLTTGIALLTPAIHHILEIVPPKPEVVHIRFAAARGLLRLLSCNEPLRGMYVDRGTWLLSLISDDSSTALREVASEIGSLVSASMECESQFVPFLRGLTLNVQSVVVGVEGASKNSPSNQKTAAAHGSILTIGAVIQCIRPPVLCDNLLPRAVEAVLNLIGHPVTILHKAACTALDRAGGSEALPYDLNICITRLIEALRESMNVENTVHHLPVSADALGAVCLGAGKGPMALGDEEYSTRRISALDALFGLLSAEYGEELQFAIGEAVRKIGCSGDLVTRSMQGSGALQQQPHRRTDTMQYVLDVIFNKLLKDTSSHINGAAVTCLLCIVKGSSRDTQVIRRVLDLQHAFIRSLAHRSKFIQECGCLGLANLYCSVVGTKHDKENLALDLIKVLGGPGRRRRLEESNGEEGASVATANFSLCEGVDGAYIAMRDIAVDVGKPELTYVFMALSSNHIAWKTGRGLKFSFVIEEKEGEIRNDALFVPWLGREFETLLPLLFRRRFDPNEKTHQAMRELWNVAVGEVGESASRQLIDSHFFSICKGLLKDALARDWRIRQSSALALAELVIGRNWTHFQPGTLLEQCWNCLDRLLDDMNGNVVMSALQYGKSLASTSIRMCGSGSAVAAAHSNTSLVPTTAEAPSSVPTPFVVAETEMPRDGQSGGELLRAIGSDIIGSPLVVQPLGRTMPFSFHPGSSSTSTQSCNGDAGNHPLISTAIALTKEDCCANASKAADILLHWIMKKGLCSSCEASRLFSVDTLHRAVLVCKREILCPLLHELIPILIEAMSVMEPAALQYMQLHASAGSHLADSLDPEKLEKIRLSVARAGPLQAVLDVCYKHLTGKHSRQPVEKLVPRLEALIREGVGLATRSAAAFLVLTLCNITPTAMASVGHRLLPTLVNVQLMETSLTLKSTYASAVAAVARLSSAPRVQKLVRRLAVLFRESDPSLESRKRSSLAVLLKSICSQADEALCENLSLDNCTSNGEESSAMMTSTSAVGWELVLPLVCLFRRETSADISVPMEDCWVMGTTALMERGILLTPSDAFRKFKGIGQELLWGLRSGIATFRVAACRAIERDFSPYVPSPRIIYELLAIVPGRVWRGKEHVVGALAAMSISSVTGGGLRWVIDVNEDSISPTTTNTDEGVDALEEDRNTVPPQGMEIIPVNEDVSTGSSVNVQSPSIQKEKKQKENGKQADGRALTTCEYTDAVGDLDAPNVVNNKMEMDDDDSTETFLPPPSLGDVVQSLIRQAKKRMEDYSKAYRRSVLESLSKILNCLSAKDCQAFGMIAPTVVPLARLSIATGKDGITTAESVEGCDEDPVLQFRALELLCSAWRGDAGASYSSGNVVQAILADLHPTKGRVWSVKVALLQFLEKILLLDSSAPKTNRSINGTQIDSIVLRVSGFIADSKFTALQKAGANICLYLIRRHHERPFEMLPHKEALTAAAEKASRSVDPDVAAIGAKSVTEVFLWH